MDLSLRRPSLELLPSFMFFADEMARHDETLWEPYYPKTNETPAEFIARQVNRESNPENGYVPESVYWGLVNNQVVGRISLRHRIEGNLLKMGGHIGYEVRPSYRRKGVATEMLRQLLLTPKAKEIGRMLLTCSPDNVGSNKTITTNGGKLAQTIFISPEYGHKNHYWIDLAAPTLRIEVRDGHSARPLVDPFYQSIQKEHRAKDSDTFFLLFENEKVIGAVRHCIEEGISILRSMNVHPDFRGRHLGVKLLQAFDIYFSQNSIAETYCIPYSYLGRFYNLIAFEHVSENDAPNFLRDRIAGYRVRFPEKSFMIMKKSSKDKSVLYLPAS